LFTVVKLKLSLKSLVHSLSSIPGCHTLIGITGPHVKIYVILHIFLDTIRPGWHQSRWGTLRMTDGGIELPTPIRTNSGWEYRVNETIWTDVGWGVWPEISVDPSVSFVHSFIVVRWLSVSLREIPVTIELIHLNPRNIHIPRYHRLSVSIVPMTYPGEPESTLEYPGPYPHDTFQN